MSVKKNFFYSSLLTVSGYLFPLVTYPYVSRVLGVNNIGICGFVDSIIQYFLLLSTLGFITIGIREVASNKTDQSKLSSAYSSILILNAVVTFLAVALLLVLIYTVPVFILYRKLFYIGIIKIVSNFLLVEWLYKGLEEFKFVTTRSILVKLIYVVAVFVFIKDEGDYVLYFLLTSLVVTVNAVINIMYSSKFVTITFKDVSVRKYLKPVVVLGLYGIITSMYTTFNITYLGIVSSTAEVGYYTTAIKFHTIIIALFTAFTGVMMPRMSSLLSNGEINEFLRMTSKSIELLIAFAIPLIVICVIFASDLIKLLAGSGYEGANIPTMIIMPLILVIGFNQVFIIQMLTPLKKDKIILRNATWGAGVGVFFNFLLVSRMGAIGSSLVWVLSEMTILIASYISVHKIIGYQFSTIILLKNIISYIPAIIVCFIIYMLLEASIIRLLIAGVFIFLYTLVDQYIVFKNEIVLQMSDIIKNKLANR